MPSKLIASTVGVSLVLMGCASSSDKVAATYVSPHQYQHYSCEQMLQEGERIRAAAIAGGAQLDKAAQNDSGIMAVSLVLFWPALFFVGGNQAKEAEYARLKGEMEAIEKARIEKNCALPPPLAPSMQETNATQPVPGVTTTVQHIKITHEGQPGTVPEVSVAKPAQ